MENKYILITPVKDEELNLPDLIMSITSQEILPSLWMIVDDGSQDSSSEIISKATQKYGWIKTIRLNPSPRDIGFKYSYVCITGFENAIQIAKSNRIEFNYIALVDADLTLKPTYFSELMKRMENDNTIGIASGSDVWVKNGDKYQSERRGRDHPGGGARIWSRRCFEDTGGYEHVNGPDSISTARAKIKGWKTIGYDDIQIYSSRPVSTAEGIWRGYIKNGEARYYLHVHPITIFGQSLLYIMKGRFKIGVAYMWGYIHAYLEKMPRISDPELISHFKMKSFRTFLGEVNER